MDLLDLKEFATDRQWEAILAIEKHGTQAKAAIALGIGSRSLERLLAKAKAAASRRGWSPDHDYTHISPPTHVVKGVSTYYDQDGLPVRQWVKSDLKKENQQAVLQDFVDSLIEEMPRYIPKPYTTSGSDELTAYVIGDAHIGMLVSENRNNNEGNWDLKIAEDKTVDAIAHLCNLSPKSKEGLFLDLGDFQHFDNIEGTTSSGKNHMDMSCDYGEVIAASVRIYRKGLDLLLEKHDHVTLMMVRGNHNSNTARAINVILQAWYENEPRITVLDNAHKFQSMVFGNNLLVTHHGDRMKAERAQEYIARSMSKEWGDCDHRHLLMGHIHHAVSKEVGGIFAEWFQALPCGDAWHSDSGYGAKRTMTAIVYDKKHGETQRIKVGSSQL